jgi:cephalosporin-C deacetylase-like acetyl esterase
MAEYSSAEEWQAHADYLRQQILWSAGLDPMPQRTPLRPQLSGKLERDGYTIENVLIETAPGFYLGGNLYRPTAAEDSRPGVLLSHGHWAYGRLENSDIASPPKLAANLALQGHVVFAYDMVGYNDTMQLPHAAIGGVTESLWNVNLLGLQLWNSIRALDFLTSLSGVDASRIYAAGASGGATQAMLLTAVDQRIAAAAYVNMISFQMQGGDVCENAPGLRIDTHNV